MKRFLCLACIACTMITLTGCEDSDHVSVVVYGTVIGAESGEPLSGVKVEFGLLDESTISSAVTGQDGYYEFPAQNVSKRVKYHVRASTHGFVNIYEDSQAVSFSSVKNGDKVKVDLALRYL